jgi:aspartate aminotransferase
MPVSEAVIEMMSRSSWIRRMFEEGMKLKESHGDKVCDFSLGNPDLEPPAAFTEALSELARSSSPGMHRYMPNGGYPETRRRIAAHVSGEQQVDLSGDHVVVTCGAGGGLNVALKSILNPGDKVLVSTPFFPEYDFYVSNHGGVLETVPGTEDFLPDVEAIAPRIDKKTAALIINSPNNPSGRIFPPETLRELGLMLEERGRRAGRAVYLIADEPYRNIVFDGHTVPPVFPFYNHSILVSSYSKDLSIPGERIGWVAVHPGADKAADLVDGIILCNRILGFVNAPALMQRAVSEILGTTIDMSPYQRRRDALCDGLERAGYEFQRPQGTFYLFPRAPGGDDVGFVQQLQKELVLAVPGKGFGAPGHFRLAFCVEESVIQRSLPGFEAALSKAARS